VCDNKSMVESINKFRARPMTLKEQFAPDVDVIRAILNLINNVQDKCWLEIKHIKGHQDKNSEKLSPEAVLNVAADKLATIALTQKRVNNVMLPGNKTMIIINGKEVTSKFNKTLRDTFHATRMHNYYQETYEWSDQTIEDIWWQVHGKAILQFTNGKRTSIQKFMHKRIACNKRENRYKPYRSEMCLQCKDIIECENHILQCEKCEIRKKGRNTYLKTLQDTMIKMGTNSTTIRVIISYLRAWLNNAKMPNLEEIAPDASVHLKATVRSQSEIGWEHWFRGRISIKWGELYNNDIEHPPFPLFRPSAIRWGKQVIIDTWNFVLNSWQTRNEIEHDNTGDPTRRQKEKLCEQILWIKSQINQSKKYPLQGITEDTLKELPIENLVVMAEQIQIEWKNP
jgi:hypothetical protein